MDPLSHIPPWQKQEIDVSIRGRNLRIQPRKVKPKPFKGFKMYRRVASSKWFPKKRPNVLLKRPSTTAQSTRQSSLRPTPRKPAVRSRPSTAGETRKAGSRLPTNRKNNFSYSDQRYNFRDLRPKKPAVQEKPRPKSRMQKAFDKKEEFTTQKLRRIEEPKVDRKIYRNRSWTGCRIQGPPKRKKKIKTGKRCYPRVLHEDTFFWKEGYSRVPDTSGKCIYRNLSDVFAESLIDTRKQPPLHRPIIKKTETLFEKTLKQSYLPYRRLARPRSAIW